MNRIFKELYARVDQEFDEYRLLTRQFKDFRWTVVEQFDFADWLLNELNESKSLSDELRNFLRLHEQLNHESLVSEFLLSYGWDIRFDLSEVFALYDRGCYENN